MVSGRRRNNLFRRSWVSWGLALTSGCWCAAQVTSGDSVLKKHYDRAQDLQSSGDLAGAASQYRIFIADALAEMAIQAAQAEDYPRAAPLFDEALRLAPQSPGLKVRYAQTALAGNDLLRTRALAEGIVRDYPGNVKAVTKAQVLLGRALSRMNQEEAARSHFEAAVALEPNFENGYALAVACLDLGDEAGAAKIFSEMVTGLGDTAALHVEIGLAYLNSDFQQKAVGEFQTAVAKDGRLQGSHYWLAVALLTTGGDEKLGTAKAELEAELALSPNDASTHAQIGSLAFRQGRYEDAERELKLAIASNGSDPSAFFYLGQMLAATHRESEAIVAYRRSIALTKDPSANRFQVQKTHYLLGRLLLQAGQAGEGKQEMQTASALLKQSLSKDRNRLAGDFAETTAGPFKKMDPEEHISPPHTQTIAALDAFQKRITPAVADSYNNLGVISASGGALDEALVSFRSAYEWNPKLEGLDGNWGLAAFQDKHYEEAVLPLRRSLMARPEDMDTRSELAVSLFRTGKSSDVLALLEPAQVDARPELRYVYAASLMSAGKREAGMTRLVALEKDDASNREVHRALAEGYAASGDGIRAAQELHTALRLEPNNGEIYYSLGALAATSGRLSEATSNLETAARLEPGSVRVHELLASTYRKGHRAADADREQAIAHGLAAGSGTVAACASGSDCR